MDSRLKKISINILKILLIGIVLYFLFLQVEKNWNEIKDFDWQISYLLLLAALILHLFTLLLFSAVWILIIKAFGHKVSMKHAFKIAYITNLARYIPGKIWSVFGMAYYAKKLGIDEQESVSSWVIAMLFTIPSAFMAGLVCLLFDMSGSFEKVSSSLDLSIYISASIFFIISILLIFIPQKIFFLANRILKKLNRKEIIFKVSIGQAFSIYIAYFFCWLVYGFAFWVFTASVTGSDLPILPAMASFILAYQIGYLAIFAPGGIGVRELIITMILTPFIGAAATGISIAARLWNLSAEFFAAVIAFFLKIEDKKNR